MLALVPILPPGAAAARRTLAEDVIEDSPSSGRTRQQRKQVACMTSLAGTSSKAYMGRLFAKNADATSDEDYNPDDEEPTG